MAYAVIISLINITFLDSILSAPARGDFTPAQPPKQ